MTQPRLTQVRFVGVVDADGRHIVVRADAVIAIFGKTGPGTSIMLRLNDGCTIRLEKTETMESLMAALGITQAPSEAPPDG
jgi:hypothetical protein